MHVNYLHAAEALKILVAGAVVTQCGCARNFGGWGLHRGR
jgi:hypothetical protein